jgi:hypothetical protein
MEVRTEGGCDVTFRLRCLLRTSGPGRSMGCEPGPHGRFLMRLAAWRQDKETVPVAVEEPALVRGTRDCPQALAPSARSYEAF